MQFKFDSLNADLVRSAPVDIHELSAIERLVRGADISAYLRNPAISDSRFLSDDGASSSEVPEDDLSDIIVWDLPGRGLPSPTDGWVRKAFACESGDYVKAIKQSCHMLTCPNCCYEKMSEISDNVKDKVMNARKYSRVLNGGHTDVLQHVVISPPKSEYDDFRTWDGFRKARAYVAQICAEIGLLGGAVIFHPFREDGVNEGLVPEDYTPDESNSLDRSVWRFSPHFHVVGFGFIKPSTSAFVHCHHGWIYSALRTGKRKMRSSADLFAVVRYTLTHVGVTREAPKRIQSVSYFGLCNSRNQVKLGEIVISRAHECPYCGGKVHLVTVGRDQVRDCGCHLKRDRYAIYATRDDKAILDYWFPEYTAFQLLDSPLTFSNLSSKSLQSILNDPQTITTYLHRKNPLVRAQGSAPRANARADPAHAQHLATV